MNTDPHIYEELLEISPFWAGRWPLPLPYSIPEHYFEGLPSRIREETTGDIPAFKHEVRSLPFEVPKGYFDELPRQVLEKLPRQQTFPIPSPPVRRLTRQLAAASVVGLLLLGGYQLLLRSPALAPKDQASLSLPDSLSQEEVHHFLEVEAIGTGEIINEEEILGRFITSDTLNPMLVDIPDTELENYLKSS
ncbi:MAG: hypothetical protein ACKO6K_09755 [Chitinophagaceae bacterium]